jgi:hypothetical protein
MFTPRLTLILYVQSIRTRSRVVLSPRSLGWLKETLHRRRALALLVVLSIMVVPVVACALPSTVTPLEPTAAPSVGPSPRPVVPYPDQGLRFERISVRHGLSHSTVNCILQDSKGFMWLGTSDGLNKYDGYSSTVYKHEPNDPHGLSHNEIRSLHQDKSGRFGSEHLTAQAMIDI